MCVLPGSHLLSGFSSSIGNAQVFFGTIGVVIFYGNVVNAASPTQVPSTFKSNQGRWHITDYEAGDVVIFNIKTIHAATANISPNFRLRCADIPNLCNMQYFWNFYETIYFVTKKSF